LCNAARVHDHDRDHALERKRDHDRIIKVKVSPLADLERGRQAESAHDGARARNWRQHFTGCFMATKLPTLLPLVIAHTSFSLIVAPTPTAPMTVTSPMTLTAPVTGSSLLTQRSGAFLVVSRQQSSLCS
jgi:hypothetical protein